MNKSLAEFDIIADIDECSDTESLAAADCSTNSECINLPGSYTCQCKHGYHGTADFCIGEVIAKHND